MLEWLKPNKKAGLTFLRVTACAVLALLLIGYALGIFTGFIPEDRKVATGDIAFTFILLLVLTFLIRPDVLDKLTLLQVGNVKLQLKEVQKDLAEIQFVLSMLVTDNELRHLDNLSKGQTSSYYRRDELLSELRRLRAIDLIRSKKYLFEMPENEPFELAEYVELTERGNGYLKRIEQTRPVP